MYRTSYWYVANPVFWIMGFTYVYVLLLNNGQLYIGLTDNLKRRVAEHRIGKVKSTKGRKLIALVYYEAYLVKSDADKRERYFKTTKGKRVLRLQLKGYFGGMPEWLNGAVC